MSRQLPRARFRSIALACAVAFGSAPLAFAQSNGNEMCGDGTTFRVDLVGTSLGIDDTGRSFRSVHVPNPARADHVDLPNGCSIYAILVTGYGQNADLTDIPFYKVAEFIAGHNGYTHVSWWNNFLKPYMGGPLHPETITLEDKSGKIQTMDPTPGNFGGFAPNSADLPKANPDEDYQFFSDASAVIKKIRQTNPNALIIVAGHSMGGSSIIRLGLNKQKLPIDLLAPIDPVNNRDLPEGEALSHTFNWTRWRVTHAFNGYRQWDCVRDSGGGCKDFDPRFFFKEYRCTTDNSPWLMHKPAIASLAPAVCPRLTPLTDPGSQLKVDSNIRRFYHRWQHEFTFPFDYDKNYLFGHTTAAANAMHQAEIAENTAFTHDPDKTCKIGNDPRDSTVLCDQTDGHGEVLGYRGPAGSSRLGLEMQHWSSLPADRHDFFLELPGAATDPNWIHRPNNPSLCMVCDDIIDMIQELLDESTVPAPTVDTTAPDVVASPAPDPNAAGWNNTDVVVDITAVDETSGSGIKEIEIDSGAMTAKIPADAATLTVDVEGTTSLDYLARDNAGNESASQNLEVHIDKTPPSISAVTTPPANANGWHNGDVTVGFDVADALSGLAGASPSTAITTEGTQEVVGTATDVADNLSSASVTVNLDKTPPIVVVQLSVPANGHGWHTQDVLVTFTATDALSGVQSVSSPVLVTVEGANQSISGTATDRAGNTGSVTAVINLDKTSPEAVIRFDPALHRIAVFGHDELSGVAGGAIAPSTGSGCPTVSGFLTCYRIEDGAGNALVITTDSSQTATSSRLAISTLDYGAGRVEVLRNQTSAVWTVDGGSYRRVEQSIEHAETAVLSKQGRSVSEWADADYQSKRGSTQIRQSSGAPAHDQLPGLAIIQLTTSNGQLRIETPSGFSAIMKSRTPLR